MSPIRKVYAKCPICKNQIEVEVNTEIVNNALTYPVSIVMQHGKPSHTMIVYIDAEYRIRAVDGHEIVLTEDTQHDALDLALAERKSLNRLADMPDLLEDLRMISGIEFVDNKGVAIISLSAAGPTIGTITSPTGRLKGRFVISGEERRDDITTAMSGVLKALEDASPLSPATMVPLLKLVEESIDVNYELNPNLIKRVAESTSLTPITSLKRSVFDVMCQHSLTDDYGAKEINLVSEMFDGKTSLFSLIRLVERKRFSILKLLIGLEILCKNDTIILDIQQELSKR